MNPSDSPKKASTPILVKLLHASAPFLSTFLLVHLSAPVFASVGGSNLSSSVMLFGREYYQTPFGEKYLLLTPFAIHVASGIARRISSFTTTTASMASTATSFTAFWSRPRRLTSALSLGAYTALFVFIPIHVLTHRLAPTDVSPPVLAVGPSELDYEFVKTGLARFPWRSWALYAGLVGSVLVHAVEGVNVIRMAWLGAGGRLSARTRRAVVGAVAIPVALGLWVVSREPLVGLASTVERYSACFAKSWVYRV